MGAHFDALDEGVSMVPLNPRCTHVGFNLVSVQVCVNFLFADNPANNDNMSPLGSPIVLQRKGSVYGANVPMITELVNDSNVQFLDQVSITVVFKQLTGVKSIYPLFILKQGFFVHLEPNSGQILPNSNFYMKND